MVIGETLRRALAKLVMRAAGEQAKMAGGNLQLCASLEAGIERATHAMGQQRIDIMRLISIVEDAGYVEVEEEYRDNVAACLTNLTIETVGTEEEAAEGLKAALGMEVDVDSEGECGIGITWQRV